MVDSGYMTHSPAGPPASKRAFDQIVVPFGIDLAGRAEVAVRRLAERANVSPGVVVGAVAGVVLWLVLRRRSVR